MDAGQIVRDLNERLVNRRDLTAIDDAFDPAFVSHTSGHDVDRAEFTAMIASLLRALPDARVEIDLVVSGGDHVAWRSVTSGTHAAEWLGIPATNRPVQWSALHIARIEGGSIREHWGSPDLISLLDQLR